MTYKINGTALTQQPENGKWISKEPLGVDGNGHPIYPALREFELSWGFISADAYNQIQGFYDAVGNTGTVVATLPQYAGATGGYFDYTGCILSEPQINDPFFQGWYGGVRLLVTGIRT